MVKSVEEQPKAPEAKSEGNSEAKPDAGVAAKPDGNGTTKPGSKGDEKDDLRSLPLAEVEKRLESSPDGLTQAEAQKRLAHYGPNEIAERKTNQLLKFLTYFWVRSRG